MLNPSITVHGLEEIPPSVFIITSIALVITYAILKGIYNVHFHPLARFPGPRIAAATNAWYIYHWLSGRQVHYFREMHKKYGPILRVAPNELSFADPAAIKEIYANNPRRGFFAKSDFYATDEAPNVVTEKDPLVHGRMRKLFSHSFSAKALAEQEDIVQEYVDLLVNKVGYEMEDPEKSKKGIDMVWWYNYITFDIIGDLAFGESFGALREGKPHFWISLVLDNIFATGLFDVFRRYPFVSKLRKFVVPRHIEQPRLKHIQYSRDQVVKRMHSDTTRKDFMSNTLRQKEVHNISEGELTSNSSILIIAGSETTATFLSGVTYYLLKNPLAYKKLVGEIRGRFNKYEDINGIETQNLPYLKAVLDEGLRIYPPVSIGLPRISPGETVSGVFIPKGTELYTHPWTLTHDEKNFHRPYDFIPERWIDPNNTDIKEASQPFSIGARGCLGRNLALLEMRVILAKMLWTYDLELVNKDLDWVKANKAWGLWHKPQLMIRLKKSATASEKI